MGSLAGFGELDLGWRGIAGYREVMRSGIVGTLLPLVLVASLPCGVASAQEEQEVIKPPTPRRIIPGKVGAAKGLATLKRRSNYLRKEALPEELIRNARIPSSVMNEVARLSDESFALRETASAALRSSPVPNEVLMAVLDREDLKPEQRHRLLRVLKLRIHQQPRGAVGIRMSPGRGGVLINELVPGLPAEKVLRVGDTIVMINDIVVRENSELVGVVQRLVPGTLIRMTVLRTNGNIENNERIEVEFPLGSYSKLGNEPDVLGLANPETKRRKELMQAVEDRFAVSPDLLEGQLATESGVIRGDG